MQQLPRTFLVAHVLIGFGQIEFGRGVIDRRIGSGRRISRRQIEVDAGQIEIHHIAGGLFPGSTCGGRCVTTKVEIKVDGGRRRFGKPHVGERLRLVHRMVGGHIA